MAAPRDPQHHAHTPGASSRQASPHAQESMNRRIEESKNPASNPPSRSFPAPSATREGTARHNSDQSGPVPSRSSNEPPRKCISRTSAGQPCRAFPLRGSELCAFHDPGYRPQLIESAARGGRGKRSTALPTPEQPLDLSTRNGIQHALGYVLNLQVAGRLSEHQSRQLTRLIATAERALDHDDPSDNLGALFTELYAAIVPAHGHP